MHPQPPSHWGNRLRDLDYPLFLCDKAIIKIYMRLSVSHNLLPIVHQLALTQPLENVDTQQHILWGVLGGRLGSGSSFVT